MNFADGFHGLRLRFLFFGDSERTAELCASGEGGAVVVEAGLHIFVGIQAIFDPLRCCREPGLPPIVLTISCYCLGPVVSP